MPRSVGLKLSLPKTQTLRQIQRTVACRSPRARASRACAASSPSILATVDPLPSLEGKTLTGGRLNAFYVRLAPNRPYERVGALALLAR